MSEAAHKIFLEALADFKAYRSHRAVLGFERLRDLDPDHPGLDLAYLKALRRDARFDLALDFQPRQRIDGAELAFERAMCHLALGDAEAALAAFDQALAQRPDMAVAWYHGHAPALALQGIDAAFFRLRRALDCPGPVNGNYRALLGAYLWLTGDREQALELARKGRHRVLIDGIRALSPHFAKSQPPALFALSAHLLTHALRAACIDGLVLEFGVRRGTSLSLIARLADQPAHGFDSFQGLPEAWGNAAPGLLSAGGLLPNLPDNAHLHPGWFEDSLPAFLKAHPGPVRFVNIDSDLYASARTVLTALAPRLRKGSVIVFDELIGNPSWKDDEYKALMEFSRDFKVDFEITALSPATKQAALRILQPPDLANSQ